MTLLALLTWGDFLWLPPICASIAVVTAAAHREQIRDILHHAARAWVVLMLGIFVFANVVSYLFEWLLPS
ncbi:MAG: hypothetical protein ACYTGN_10415 [Planctomycetota bacterium]|jgi:hypothetical protein